MRRAFMLLLLLLSQPLTLFAETAAQRVLENEPEMRQITAMSEDMKTPQRSPNDNPQRRQSPVGTAVDQTVSIRQMNGLMDQLEDRLNREARACNFCPAKQEELSELIRQRAMLVDTSAHILGHDRASFMMNLAGITPTETRWTNIRIPFHEAGEAVRAHCTRFTGPQEAYCQGDGIRRMAGDHENAWAACFNANNWVEDASKRRAYEACMSATDPLTQMCERDRQAGIGGSCPAFTVSYMDVNALHFYHDRWVVDPTRLPAAVGLIPGQPVHVTLLEPIVAPPGPYPGNTFTITVRGRLDNPLDGESEPRASPSLREAAEIAPELLQGLKGRVELLPAGTDVPVTVRVVGFGGTTVNGGQLDLMINSQTIGPSKNNQLISQSIFKRIPWPAPGTVIVPVNTAMSFATACNCMYDMTLAEFRQRLAARAAAPPAPVALTTRTILQGSRVQTVLVEPITVSGIQSGKRFHAQLNADMQTPRGTNQRDDALELPRGTDVYLKVTDPNGSQPGGHIARLWLDYAVVNGQQVPLISADGWPIQFGLPAPNAPRSVPRVDVLMPAGHATWWSISEQTDVSVAGLTPEQVKRKVPPPDRNEQIRYGDDALRRAIADYNSSWLGFGIIGKGTISRVEQVGNWEILHFQESADDGFVVCVPLNGLIGPRSYPNEIRGNDFSGFVGKTVELRGRVAHPLCAQQLAGMDVQVPTQIRVLDAPGPARTPAVSAK